jgi:hypothetical protein
MYTRISSADSAQHDYAQGRLASVVVAGCVASSSTTATSAPAASSSAAAAAAACETGEPSPSLVRV